MKILINAFKAILVFALLGNILFSYYIYLRTSAIEADLAKSNGITAIYREAVPEVATPEAIDLSDYAKKSYVESAIAGVSGQPIVTQAPVVTSTPKKEVTFIPITGGFSTQSLDWVDVPGTDFYLDLAVDYGLDATATWEAFLREEHANGFAEARIKDVTHGIVVANSEISTNSAASTLVTSANLAIWKGKNLYRIQTKSQKGFVVFFDSGRIKISS